MTIQTDLNISLPFDYYAPEYRCCCNAIHVKQGVQIIGVIQFILVIFSFIALLFVPKFDHLWGSLEAVSLVVEIFILLCVFFGVKKQNHQLLLPYIVYELIWILTSISIALFGIYAFIKPDSRVGHIFHDQLVEVTKLNQFNEKELEETDEHLEAVIQLSAILTTVSFLISMIGSAWWLLVVYKCYIYFKQLARARKETDFSVRYNSATNFL